MIDTARLDQAFHENGFYSIQLEVGKRCHQGCIYCYMNAVPAGGPVLDDEVIDAILHDAARLGITAIEWLGGEPLLRDSLLDHMVTVTSLGLRNNLWTGGLPLVDVALATRCARACKDGLVSVHVSTVDPLVYARLHPGSPAGDLAVILRGVRNLLDAGYPPGRMLNSTTLTGLQDPTDAIATIDYFETTFDIVTSLNVYHTYLRPGQDAGDLARFIPGPGAVAKVQRRCAKQHGADRLPMNCVNKQYCSTTLAVLHDGSVTPCATIRESGSPVVGIDGSLLDIVNQHRNRLRFATLADPANLPLGCASCVDASSCWGCRSRAFAAGRGIHGKDPRCFRSG